MTNHDSQTLDSKQQDILLHTLQKRFEGNMHRHQGLEWSNVRAKLVASPNKLWSLSEMERTGGEPDVVQYDSKLDQYMFVDCSKESPKGRRKVCYDRQALEARKKYKPENSAMDMAEDMGMELLTEDAYRMLQQVEQVDLKTSSWIQTPNAIRELGGALFGDCRYDHVFIYHNGADSYYTSRGFRGLLKV